MCCPAAGPRHSNGSANALVIGLAVGLGGGVAVLVILLSVYLVLRRQPQQAKGQPAAAASDQGTDAHTPSVGKECDDVDYLPAAAP